MTALFLIAGAFLVYLFSTPDSWAEGSPATCADVSEFAVLPSPIAPWTGAPLRVLVVAEKPLEGEVSLIAPDGSVAAKSRERHGGPPYFWYAEVASPAAGTWRAKLARDGAPAECSAMTRDIVFCFEDDDIIDAADLMRQKKVRRLPVLNRQKRLIGIVSLGDLAVEAGVAPLAEHALKGISDPSAPVR